MSSRAQAWDAAIWAEARAIALREARRVLSRHDAEDAAQEAMLRAWRQRHSCRAPAEAGAWFAQIGRNEALRRLPRTRRAMLELATNALDVRSADDATLELAPEVLTLRHCLDKLPRADRLLVSMRYERDMTTRQIANATGMPEGTVKVRLHRLRSRLRVDLSDDA